MWYLPYYNDVYIIMYIIILLRGIFHAHFMIIYYFLIALYLYAAIIRTPCVVDELQLCVTLFYSRRRTCKGPIIYMFCTIASAHFLLTHNHIVDSLLYIIYY